MMQTNRLTSILLTLALFGCAGTAGETPPGGHPSPGGTPPQKVVAGEYIVQVAPDSASNAEKVIREVFGEFEISNVELISKNGHFYKMHLVLDPGLDELVMMAARDRRIVGVEANSIYQKF